MSADSQGIRIGSPQQSNLQVGTERMGAGVFFRMICNWKDSDVSPSKFKAFPEKECLPFQSVVHLLDNFKNIEEGQTISDICSFDYPFIRNDGSRKLLYTQMAPLTDGWISTPHDYIYRTMQLTRNIEKFRSTNGGRFIITRNLKDLARRDPSLAIINHNPIFRLFVRGTMQNWRVTQHYLASIFNIVAEIPDKMHYFVIPLTDKIFVKGKFNQLATRVTTGSIMDKKSIQYCLFAQLYNFLNVNCTLKTVFDDIPESARKSIVLVFEHAGHFLFWPLQTLKDLNPRNKIFLRLFHHFNGFILRGMVEKAAKTNPLDSIPEDTETSSLHLETEIVKTYSNLSGIPINEVRADEESTEETDATDYVDAQDTADLEEIIRRVEAFTPISGAKSTILDLTDVNAIIEGEEHDSEEGDKQPGNGLDAVQDLNDVPDNVPSESGSSASRVSEISGKDFYTEEELSQIRLAGTDVKPFTTKDEVKQSGIEYLGSLYSTVTRNIDTDYSLTKAQKERAKKMALSFKEVKLDNKTLEEHLIEAVNPTLDEDVIDFIPDTVIADKSMLKSSITTMDNVYMERMFNRHLAGVATSFASQGMYIQEINKNVVNTELSQVAEYVFKYKTVTGKQHSAKFSFPIVRSDGTFLVNGVRSTMSKQLTTKPIAKLTATRVSLASYYNKTIVEKLASSAHDYLKYFTNVIQKVQEEAPKNISSLEYGIHNVPAKELCGYEYWQVAQKFHSFVLNHVKQSAQSVFYFGDRKTRFTDELFTTKFKMTDADWKKVEEYEKKHTSIFIGVKRGNAPYCPGFYFMDMGSKVHLVGNYKGEDFDEAHPLLMWICNITEVFPAKQLTEWTDIKILDAKFPVGFLLCYRFGLRNVLRRLKVKHEWIPGRTRTPIDKINDVAIPFQDGTLIVPRYPLKVSLILQGLMMFDTKVGAFEDFDHKDIYFQLLLDRKMGAGRTNYLIGIDDTFDMFVDVITYERLKQMNEPTDFGGLLVRATEMLSVPYHESSAAMANHCLRSYERFNGILYNEMAAQMRQFKKQRGPAATFSINPNAVLQRIVQDQTVMPVEDINPIHDIKTNTKLTYLGMGGRTAESITTNDRRFPPDGLGIVSESTPSAGNVGVVCQSSMDPEIINLSGLLKTDEDINALKPTQILSAASLFSPCVTQDDPKRICFNSNFISHTVPTKCGEVLRVRTGYETIIPYRCNDLYAYTAKDDGVVVDLNEKLRMVKVRYENGTTESFSYDPQYGQCSDMLVEQQQKLTVKKGDKFGKNEVLRYNPQYFTPDCDNPRIIGYNHGVTARVALLETSATFVDSNSISRSLSEKLEIYPVVDRLITIPAQALIHEYKKIGDSVESNTPLLIFERDDATDIAGIGVDDQALSYLEGLNRLSPKAKNTGKIVDIKVLYAGELSDMHQSLEKMIRDYTAHKKAVSEYAQDSTNKYLFAGDSKVPVGSKYKGITLDENTIILQYYIQGQFAQGSGDKIVFDSSLKSVSCSVMDNPPTTERGYQIDAIFAPIGISHRIINSPLLVGVAEHVLEELEKKCVDIYFGKGKGTEALSVGGDKKDVFLDLVTEQEVHTQRLKPLMDDMSLDMYGVVSDIEEWYATPNSENHFIKWRTADNSETIVGYTKIEWFSHVGRISVLYICKDYRHKGIGTAIYPKILQYIKNHPCAAVRTSYRTENPVAGKLYKKFGLIPIGHVYKAETRHIKPNATLPVGYEYYPDAYVPTDKQLSEWNRFFDRHWKDILPVWIKAKSDFRMKPGQSVLVKKDMSGNIVAMATFYVREDIIEFKERWMEIFYPVANTEADLTDLMNRLIALGLVNQPLDDISYTFSAEHKFKNTLFKFGKSLFGQLGMKFK